jgi:hypothetical protein
MVITQFLNNLPDTRIFLDIDIANQCGSKNNWKTRELPRSY